MSTLPVPERIDKCVTCKLRQNHLFCSLSEELVRAMQSIKTTAVYPKGTILCLEGQPSRGVYILCSGRARLSATSPDGKIMIVGTAEPGEVLGLSAVVAGKPYAVSVETAEPSQANFIARADFMKFLESNAEVGMKVAQQLTHYCRSAYGELRALGLAHSVPQRFARLLLHWSEDNKCSHRSREGKLNVRVTATREEMAQMIGSSRETVSRTISDFKENQFIEVRGSLWTISNPDALRLRAEGV